VLLPHFVPPHKMRKQGFGSNGVSQKPYIPRDHTCIILLFFGFVNITFVRCEEGFLKVGGWGFTAFKALQSVDDFFKCCRMGGWNFSGWVKEFFYKVVDVDKVQSRLLVVDCDGQIVGDVVAKSRDRTLGIWFLPSAKNVRQSINKGGRVVLAGVLGQ